MESLALREILSQNLKKYRKLNGWSQFELAEKTGLSEQTINSIEGLRLWPSDKTLTKISNVFGIDIYHLFIPPKISLHSNSVSELKHTVIKTVEDLLGEILTEYDNS